jgi:hypothetical protein
MFISRFSVEDWQGNQDRILVKIANEWPQIEVEINKLDGKHQTLVTLEAEGEIHMAVGGGKGKYLVYLTFDNEHFYYVALPSKMDLEETLVVGGQEGVYPAKLCVDKDTALQAAKTFAELGTMDNSLLWKKDEVFELV